MNHLHLTRRFISRPPVPPLHILHYLQPLLWSETPHHIVNVGKREIAVRRWKRREMPREAKHLLLRHLKRLGNSTAQIWSRVAVAIYDAQDSNMAYSTTPCQLADIPSSFIYLPFQPLTEMRFRFHNPHPHSGQIDT